MGKRLAILAGIWWRMLAWGIFLGILGGALYGAVNLSLDTSTFKYGLSFILFVFGELYGIVIGLIDGFVLGVLMATRAFQPQTAIVDRWFLRAVCAIIAAVIVKATFTIPEGVVQTGIAAICAWFMAHRVLMNQPDMKAKRKNDGVLN